MKTVSSMTSSFQRMSKHKHLRTDCIASYPEVLSMRAHLDHKSRWTISLYVIWLLTRCLKAVILISPFKCSSVNSICIWSQTQIQKDTATGSSSRSSESPIAMDASLSRDSTSTSWICTRRRFCIGQRPNLLPASQKYTTKASLCKS